MLTVPDQTGRRFVVTGSYSCTSEEAAARVAEAGAPVVRAVRSLAKGEAAKGEILRRAPGAGVEVRRLDLMNLLMAGPDRVWLLLTGIHKRAAFGLCL